jgi:hypothetical protein
LNLNRGDEAAIVSPGQPDALAPIGALASGGPPSRRPRSNLASRGALWADVLSIPFLGSPSGFLRGGGVVLIGGATSVDWYSPRLAVSLRSPCRELCLLLANLSSWVEAGYVNSGQLSTKDAITVFSLRRSGNPDTLKQPSCCAAAWG